jgi:hypothetical protein
MIKIALLKKYNILIFVIPTFIIFSHLQKRPVNHEGGQSNIDSISQKIDWWGSILPIITPSEKFIYESLYVSIISLSIFTIGVALTLKYSDLLKKDFLTLSVLLFSGYSFVIPNSRDSFLLSFAMLNFGIINFMIKSKKYYLISILFLGLVIAVSFKYVTGLTVAFILLYYFIRRLEFKKHIRYFIIIVTTLIVTTLGIVFDKTLADLVNLKKSYPEQQPIFQDLAAFYCWSDDPITRQYALKAMEPVVITQDPKDICLTLRPNSWGYLITGGNFKSNGILAPLKKINEEEGYKLPRLITGWAKTIINDPVDYVQFKLISSTQIISVGHPFKYPLNTSQFTNESDVIVQVSKNSESLISKISDYSWTINRFLLKLIGSTYLFSIAILFLILFIMSLTKTKLNLKNDTIVFLFLSQMFNLAILSISYVSDEARYVFPSIYISYLIMVNDIKLKTIDGHGPKDFS